MEGHPWLEDLVFSGIQALSWSSTKYTCGALYSQRVFVGYYLPLWGQLGCQQCYSIKVVRIKVNNEQKNSGIVGYTKVL